MGLPYCRSPQPGPWLCGPWPYGGDGGVLVPDGFLRDWPCRWTLLGDLWGPRGAGGVELLLGCPSPGCMELLYGCPGVQLLLKFSLRLRRPYLSTGPGTRGRPLFTGLWQVAPGSHRRSSCGPLGAGPAVPGPCGWLLLGVFWCGCFQGSAGSSSRLFRLLSVGHVNVNL